MELYIAEIGYSIKEEKYIIYYVLNNNTPDTLIQ